MQTTAKNILKWLSRREPVFYMNPITLSSFYACTSVLKGRPPHWRFVLLHYYVCVGLARTIYKRCIYGIFGREIIKYTVIYGACIRFWPTLRMWLAINQHCCGRTLSKWGWLGAAHKHTQTHTHMQAHTDRRAHTTTHTHIQTHRQTHTQQHTRTHIQTHTHTHTHTHIPMLLPYRNCASTCEGCALPESECHNMCLRLRRHKRVVMGQSTVAGMCVLPVFWIIGHKRVVMGLFTVAGMCVLPVLWIIGHKRMVMGQSTVAGMCVLPVFWIVGHKRVVMGLFTVAGMCVLPVLWIIGHKRVVMGQSTVAGMCVLPVF